MFEYIKNNQKLVVHLILLIIFVIIISIGYIDSKRDMKDLQQNGLTTEGTVINFKQRGTFRHTNSRGYLVVYEYGVNDTIYKDIQSVGRRKDYKKGQKVKILYSKKNPENSMLIRNNQNKKGTLSW